MDQHGAFVTTVSKSASTDASSRSPEPVSLPRPEPRGVVLQSAQISQVDHCLLRQAGGGLPGLHQAGGSPLVVTRSRVHHVVQRPWNRGLRLASRREIPVKAVQCDPITHAHQHAPVIPAGPEDVRLAPDQRRVGANLGTAKTCRQRNPDQTHMAVKREARQATRGGARFLQAEMQIR